MPSVLDEIVANKRLEVEERKRALPLASFEVEVSAAEDGFLRAFETSDLHLIAEIKPRSPSKGVLRKSIDIDSVIGSYNRFASAISVLTDKKYFDGSLELLSEVSHKSSLPTLCKDFIIDRYQCFEARRAGAQGVLLIVKSLTDKELQELHAVIRHLHMVPVVEVQNETELERALALNPLMVLINNRNLDTMMVDLETTEKLAPLIPRDVKTVSASGIQSREDIEKLLPYCSNFLIGSILMQSGDVDVKLKELLGVPSVLGREI